MSAVSAEGAGRAVMGQLETSEIVLLWCLRQRLAAGADSPLLAEGLCRAFGTSGVKTVSAAFEAAYLALAKHLLWDFVLMPPGCGCLSTDEVLFLRLCATIQHNPLAYALDDARSLVGPIRARPLCAKLNGLVVIMGASGLHLPVRAPDTHRVGKRTYH